jgi:hypothetical protein
MTSGIGKVASIFTGKKPAWGSTPRAGSKGNGKKSHIFRRQGPPDGHFHQGIHRRRIKNSQQRARRRKNAKKNR